MIWRMIPFPSIINWPLKKYVLAELIKNRFSREFVFCKMANSKRINLVQTLDVKDQPKLDSEFTKGRFKGQVIKIEGFNMIH